MPFCVEYRGCKIPENFETELQATDWATWNYKGRSGWRVVPAPSKVRFEIDCGNVRQTIEAPTPHDAWMKFNGPANTTMARFREVPWNAVYTWTMVSKRGRRWYSVAPDWFMSNEAHLTTQSELFAHGDLKN